MKNSKIRFLFRVLLSAGLIGLLLSRLDWSAVFHLIRAAHPQPLVAGFLLGVLGQLLMAERTRLMLRHWKLLLGHPSAYAVTWIGQFCNNFLPGGVGGDMVKFYRVGRLYPQAKAAALVALVADRLLALVALVVLSVAALACGDPALLKRLLGGLDPGAALHRLPVWWLVGLFALAFVGVGGAVVWRFRRAVLERGATHIRSIREAVALGNRVDGRLVAAFGLAVGTHAIGMFSALFFAHALEIPLGVGQIFLVWPVVLVAMMAPVSVNGYGLREFILLYYFEQWHLTSHVGAGAGIKESVVVLSLLVAVSDLLCNLPGGLLLLAPMSAAPAPAATSRLPSPLP